MAVNMEVEKNTSKEVDTRLTESDSAEFNDGNKTESENIEKPEDLLSSFKNITIDRDNCDSTVVYEQRKDPKICAEHLEKNHMSNDEDHDEKTDCLPNLQAERILLEKKTVKNECKIIQRELTSENSVDGYASQAPLAFTIDFGNDKEVDKTKYHNLFERYNARHKRNLSMSKVEISTKKAATLMSPNLIQKQKVSSTHSEGYFSSEDDTKRKTDQLSEKLKQLGSKSFSKSHTTKKFETTEKVSNPQFKQNLMTRSCDDQSKQGRLSRKNLSLELGCSGKRNTASYWMPQKSATINDLSRIQTNNYDDDTEKLYTKNIDPEEDYKNLSHDVTEKVSNINYVRNKTMNAKEHNLSSVSYTMEVNTDDSTTNIDVFNVSKTDGGSDDAVSEAGTYTIHKDYTDEEKARMDIDKVFSVGILTEEESNEACIHNFKMSVSKDNNTWISEWATQVAEHNSLPPAIGGATGRTPPLSPSKIPSPIHARSQRLSRSRNEQSDSSLDAESYLRLKERVGLASNQHIFIDSGGESDDDTSNSYNTPPHSSQRTPVHSLARRGSLSESLFRRINTSENRRNMHRYLSSSKSKTEDVSAELLNSPSQDFASLHLGRRSSSLDRRECTSDTTESNTSRRSSTKCYQEQETRYTNSPVLSRLRPSTPKLTNSPIVARKTVTKIINSPVLERTKHLTKSSPQAKNIGYFTCVENSPYMLRKSNSTTSYHEGSIGQSCKETLSKTSGALQTSSNLQRNLTIQRSCSNANIRNSKLQSLSSRRSRFNSNDADRTTSVYELASDSSSDAGEQQIKSSIASLSSGIKLNRAFSIRRARLNCDSDTTPNTTPEERRKRAQHEVKLTTPLNKQPNYHRSRTSNSAGHNKESLKKSDTVKPKISSISRADSTRYSMRAPKSSHLAPITQRSNQKIIKDHKKSGRSNSALTSKEVEFQNWKRRNSYDPMKAAAEGKKKLIDSSKKHHSTEDSSGNNDNSVLRSASFHGTGGVLSLANDWSDNESRFPSKNNQVPPPCSPQLEGDSDLETSYYLQTTQNVVSAMSARITVSRSPIDSDNQRSDTESSDDHQPLKQSSISNAKYNRAYRTRLESQPAKSTGSMNKSRSAAHDTRGKSEPVTSISRTDSGRFSMRLTRTSSANSKAKTHETKKPTLPNAREVEMQNWKRRKSYDPRKAAMEGRRKAGLVKKNTNANLSPSHVARSRSFHGSAGLGVSDWSDEDLVVSADEAAIY